MAPISSPRTRPTTTLFHGHVVSSTAPRDGIPSSVARKRYGLADETLWEWIDAGKVAAGVGRNQNNQPSLMVSQQALRRVLRTSNTWAAIDAGDGEPARVLSKEFNLNFDVLCKWCSWETHPGIGRKIKSGFGTFVVTEKGGKTQRRRGLIVSRADIVALVEAIRQPLNRSFPNNPGQWIAEGIFLHEDGRLFYSERYVRENKPRFGIAAATLFHPARLKRLDAILATWPGSASNKIWKLTVFSVASLDKLVDFRGGKVDGGRWDVAGKIWSDAEGAWYSSGHVAQLAGVKPGQIHTLLRASGATSRFKSVPTGNGRRSTIVHHESDVRPLLGIGGQAEAPKRKGGRPRTSETEEVQKYCYTHWYAQLKTLTVIRRAAEREFGTRAPKEDAHVTMLAQRYAKNHGLPMRGK